MKQEILKQALANAINYGGKANPGAVIGRIINQFKDKDTKEIALEVNKIIKEVNSLSLEEQKAKLESLGGVEETVHKRKEGLKDLPNVKGSVIMRFAPSPSGPLHVGHAYILGLNYEYIKKYDGKLIIRIEDTNADNIYPDAYKMIPEDANWLCDNKVDDVVIQSDRMEIYYKYAEKLFESGHLYVCDCDNEEFKKALLKGISCECRNLAPEAQIKRFRKMFDKEDGYDMGEVVVRFKSDIHHKNPAMRDFPLLRINDSPHPRTGNKYRVWPLMNFAVSIDDLELGVTHALRGKDHADNAKRQEMIHHVLNFKTPEAISVGRINFEGFEVSCSKTKERIKNKEFTGWDDIRIPFLPALRRRGYSPEAFRRYAMEVGITKTDKSVEINEFFKTINAFNKEVVDSKAHRFFFITDPVEINIEGAPEQHIEMDLHPENKLGGRKFKVKDSFLLQKSDVDSFKDEELIRLMDCLNFMKKGKGFVFESKEYEKFKGSGSTIIHWVPKSNDLVNVEVLMPDNTTLKGVAENTIKTIKVGHVVQLERFGFARLDSFEKNLYKFWFCHK